MSAQWTGVTYNDKNEPCCEKCGGDQVDVISHVDADTWYSWTYECCACGHTITMTADRDPESIQWHDEPMEEKEDANN